MAMKKMTMLGLMLILSLVLVLPAAAARKQLAHFSVEVPDGWTVTEDSANDSISFMAKDRSAGLTITFMRTEGKAAKKMAGQLAEKFAAPKKPVYDKNLNGYTFEFKNENGVPSSALVAEDGEKLILMFFFGNDPDAFNTIMDSIQ